MEGSSAVGQLAPRRQAGRCVEHDDLAWVYEDGSIGCMGALVIEASTLGCSWLPMPPGWLEGPLRNGSTGGDTRDV